MALPPEQWIGLHASGALLLQTSEDAGRAFAGRLDALRVVAGAAATRVLHRRMRETDTSEVLGGLGSPLVRIAGNAQIVMGARPGNHLVPLALEEDLAFVREDVLLGFETRLSYENGRIALEHAGEGARGTPETGVHVVQLRGTGVLVVELTGALASLSSTAGSPLLVRREWVVGWLGRLVTRALPAAESPSGQRGLVAFSGDGIVLICTG
jgi:uncharacterized protein (AIM24 family)